MVLYEKKQQAREMRIKGDSILTISKKLGVSKSSVSIWCEDIKLTTEQVLKLDKNRYKAGESGRLLGTLANKNKKIESIKRASKEAGEIIGHLNRRDTVVASIALYWAEGSKSTLTTGFQFINSDPDMIIFIKKFLKILGVKNEDMFCTIQINIVHKPRINEVLKFWKNLLEFKNDQIRNPSFIISKNKKVYENHDRYYGICRLQVKKSTFLKYKMIELIKVLKNDILLPV